MTYGIVGLGRFAFALANELATSGAELIVLDHDEERVSEMRELTENAYIVNCLDKKALEESGIQNCDVAVVCIGERMDTSILTTLNLVSLRIPKVLARATSIEPWYYFAKARCRGHLPGTGYGDSFGNPPGNNERTGYDSLE